MDFQMNVNLMQLYMNKQVMVVYAPNVVITQMVSIVSYANTVSTENLMITLAMIANVTN